MQPLPPKLNWAKFATICSVSVALILTVVKAYAWRESGSAAILGSLADSLMDLVSSVIAFIGVRKAAEPADANHRFGHHKAEAVSSLVQLVLISGSAVFVFAESLKRLVAPEAVAAPELAMGVMVFSILLTAALVLIQTIAIRRQGSLATQSDRAHYLGDFLANAGALVAVFLAANLGLLWADGVAGLVAAGFLAWSVISIARQALPQLMDEELGASDRAKILTVATADPDVMGAHALRTRQAGPVTYIQLHLEMEGAMTLEKAHLVSDRVEGALRAHFPSADILLHQDPHGQTENHDEFGSVQQP